LTRTERQAHGFVFQDWVFRKFLSLAYSGDWDIPAKVNPLTHKNVSIKTAQWKKGSIDLGDIFKQFDIYEDFEMLLAFYINDGKRKKIVNMQLLNISKDKWRELWGNMKREYLEKFDSYVKCVDNRNLKGEKLDIFRADVQNLKKELFCDYNGKISINPKIDSKSQRRVQCSISFNDIFNVFGLDDKKKEMTTCNLWGEEIRLSDIKLD
jgi:hypothetical protein